MYIGDRIEFLEKVDSTNAYIKRNLDTFNSGTVVWALEQSQGRGRLKRQWSSERNGNLYFSFFIKDYFFLKQLTQFPILISVALRRTIVEFFKGVDLSGLKLKWPNDLLYNEAKLAGILMELDTNSIVCGIGLNVEKAPMVPNKKTACIRDFIGVDKSIEQSDFIALFCKTLNISIEEYLLKGFSVFKHEWELNCHHMNKKVALSGGIEDNTPKTEALFLGLNMDGGALVFKDGVKKTIYSGELDV